MPTEPARWHLLLHQIPTKPDYLRVKVGRRLARLGAVPIRNGVYALPASDAALEDLAWTLSEIIASGGEGCIVEARLLQGLSDEEIAGRFRAARDEDYAPLAAELRVLLGAHPSSAGEVERLRRRFAEVVAIDYFGARGREEVEALLAQIDALRAPAPSPQPADWTGRVWVTRKGVKVDRIASAWLIRRFVDPGARFKFVDPRGYTPVSGELRFDMSPAEFTHEGPDCTFEVLLRRLGIAAPGLGPLAEIIHDIDLKDGHFGRAEAAGVSALIDGIAAGSDDDEERLRQGFLALDALLRALARG